jgi:hypothetical protein
MSRAEPLGIAPRHHPLAAAITALTSPVPASHSRPATAYQGHWPDARTPLEAADGPLMAADHWVRSDRAELPRGNGRAGDDAVFSDSSKRWGGPSGSWARDPARPTTALSACYSAAVRTNSGAAAGRRISSHSAEITADTSAKAAST